MNTISKEVNLEKKVRSNVLKQLCTKIFKMVYSLLAIFIFLLFWEIAPRIGLADPAFVPPFSKVMVSLWKMILSGEIFKHIFISLERAIIGFGLAAVISIPLGFLIGWFKKAERFLDPLLQTFRQTSALALLPVFILIFGIGEVSKIAIIFWGVQWPILINTISGVKTVDPLLIKSARSMGASPLTLFRKVVLPGAFPSIFTGIRLSATSAILILIAAEMIGSNSGLGYLIYQSQVTFQVPSMYAAILTIALLGVLVNYILVSVEKRIMKWKEDLPASGN